MQIAPDSLPDRTWDAVVVGAGPAGAACAAHLGDRGHRVLLMDGARFPREKVCGDCLGADAMGCLGRLGLLDDVRAAGRTVRGVDVYSPSRIRLPLNGEFVTIRRRELDEIVAGRAVGAGAAFCQARIDRIDAPGDGPVACSIFGNGRPVHARVAIVATGAKLGLLEKLGMSARPRPSGVALRCYVRSRSGPERLVVSYEKGLLPGYGWIFPMGDGGYNVGVSVFRGHANDGAAHLRGAFEEFARLHPASRAMMEAAEHVTSLCGGIIRSAMRGARPVGEGRVLAIGETIGTTLPYTGEGIGKAMETGELAAKAVDDALGSGDLSRLRRYGERIDAEFRPRYSAYLRAERWLAVPWLNDLLARAARHFRAGRAAAGDILSEAAGPADLFSFGGLVRVLCGR